MELNPTFRLIIKIFYLFGIWRNEEACANGKIGIKLFYVYYFIFYQIFLMTCAFLSDDNNEFIFLTEGTIFVAVVTVKGMYVLWKKEEILDFLFSPREVNLDYYESENVTKKLKFIKFVNVYLFLLGCNIISATISCLPIFTSEKKLPLFISFSLDFEYAEIIYWMAYAYIISGLFCCVVFNFITVIIWNVMLNYSIEYELLGYHLRKLGWSKSTKSHIPHSMRNIYHQELIGLINIYQHLFERIERFKSCFYALFLVQIITGGTSICVSTYNLAYCSFENAFQTIIFVIALLYGIFDILLVLYLANDITLASGALSYCLFESNWIDQSQSYKKSLIIMSEFLKQPQSIMVLIYPLNLATFTRIIMGAYNMFNVLRNFE